MPDVFVPSDRDIPRSVNEGTPIVATKQHSGAAKAFRKLADRYAQAPAAGMPAPAAKAKQQSGGRTLMGRRR